jgi:SMC interacting uncharacterized protein involved in chromosome segregation
MENLYKQFEAIKAQSYEIDTEAETKLKKIEEDLHIQLSNRDLQLSEFKKEKEEKINLLKSWQDDINDIINKIKEIIQNKVDNCLNEAEDLTGWSIIDTQDELFAKPIQWVYMPIYAMIVEDENLMEEKINVIFPGYIGTIDSLYENISSSFSELKTTLIERFENDMKTRSNFEFTIENKNIIKDPNFDKKIQMGISILRNKGLVNDQIEAELREKLNLLA